MAYLNYLKFISVIGILVGYFAQPSVSQNCGCSGNLCCSQYGYCGTGDAYCGKGCQSGPCSTSSAVSLENIVTPTFFSDMVSEADSGCDGKNFYSYDAFLEAAKSYPSFGRTGSMDDSKREIAAFFAHATHVTGHFCYKEEINGSSKDYCDEGNKQFPCASGKQYYGRGPIQLTWNYNYGPAGKSIGFDGINDPDTVTADAVISFKTALWFWMNNIHSIITSNQGFGPTIRAVNGMECNGGNSEAVQARVSYYNTYCTQLSVEPGNNLSC